MTTDRIKPEVDLAASGRRTAWKRAFTLVEVLIAAIILAIGLVGLAAVFPAVISQQQAANDLTTAVSVSSSADGLLATRLPAFRARFNDPIVVRRLGTTWNRVNAVEGADPDVFYLQAPWRPPFPVDLRLREQTSYLVPQVGFGGGSHREFTVRLPRGPIAQDGKTDDLRVRVYYTENFVNKDFALIGDPFSPNPKFIVEDAAESWRLAPPTGPNAIDYQNARIQFYFNLEIGEVLDRVVVEYRWLNDRIVSHPDRLYPSNAPRYGWEIAFRRSADGQLQYTTFVYRFDGLNAEFVPEIPGRWSIPTNERLGGMLRLGNATVAYNNAEDRYELRTSGTGMADQVEAGSWVLPVEGTNALRVRRLIDSPGSSPWFELEGPPMWVDPADGVGKPLTGNVEFWYMPTTIKAFSDQGQEIGVWRIRPLLATTKQVQL